MLNILLFGTLAFTVIATFIRPSYGLACFISARILIPEVVRTPGLEGLSFNSTLILIIAISVLVNGLAKTYTRLAKDTYFKCLMFFICSCAVLLPFSSYEDLQFQYNSLIQYFFTDILPIILTIAVVKTKCDLRIVVQAFLWSTILCCVYAIIVYLMQKNPYVNYFQAITGWRDTSLGEEVWYTTGRGVSTSGTFLHANGFGYFISMSIPLFIYLQYTAQYNKRIIFIALVLLIVNVFLCKKRSPIVSIGVFLILWMYLKRKTWNVLLYVKILLLGTAALLIIFMVPALESIRSMIETSFFFWDDKLLAAKDVGGSSWELRILQVVYPFIEIKDNILFGKGFGWCSWYLNQYELHPVLFGFETILSTAVCQFGILGYLMYYMLFYQSYKYSRPYKNGKVNYQLLALVTMIALVVATGLNYFFFFGIGSVIMNKREIFMHEKDFHSHSVF